MGLGVVQGLGFRVPVEGLGFWFCVQGLTFSSFKSVMTKIRHQSRNFSLMTYASIRRQLPK